ncbi:MAG TPA: stage 0 sporulation family protein [Candidatus Faecimorpha stercoravium]|nr:stage 0 sporulation family protein [Candidatus Faecimorpha stercoravium]
MITVIGVRFRHGGKIYYFQPGVNRVERGDHVIVETSRGVEYGMVVQSPRLASDQDIVAPVRTILRKATEKDEETNKHNIQAEKEAMEVCREKIAKRGLEMKLVDAEYTFDGNKILFYFTAEGRVDFRELVKDLAAVFRTRIELRQIGVRDEARACPGMGICGRPFCCQTFLPDFIPVSIKMAKDQNLSLNPTKISGTCGRLMCCLKYEESTYEELTRKLPAEGDLVQTPNGVGEVLHVNVLRQLLKVGVRQNEKGDVEIAEYPLDEIEIVRRKRNRNKGGQPMDQEEKKQLEELEQDHGGH